MTTTTLLGKTRQDLLAIPGILFGFHPAESLVVMGIRGTRVIFGSRMDLSATQDELDHTLQLVTAVADREGCRELVVVGFSGVPARAEAALANIWEQIGQRALCALVTDGRRYWEYQGTGLQPAEGIVNEVGESVMATQAVFEGIRVRRDRTEAVAEVLPPPAHELAVLAEGLDEAASWVAVLDPDERMELLRGLMESEDLSDDDAAALVCLLQDDEAAGEVLRALTIDTAELFRRNLVHARRVSVGSFDENVVGLLGIACWLAGEGAQQTECIYQLDRLESTTSVLPDLLRTLHAGAIPPSRWEEWN